MIGSANPFFAPIAAVITLAVSVGQRLRRTTELVLGVAIGIGVADGIILLIGSGPWQIGLIVFLAILTAPPWVADQRSSCSRRRRPCWSPP